LCFLATDDFFLPGKLEKQVAFLDANPATMAVFGLPKHVDEDGWPLPSGYGDFSIPFQAPLRTRVEWLRHFFFIGNCVAHPTSMVRRSGYDEVGLFDPRLAGLPDFDMWVRLCMKGEIHVMRDELTAIRILNNARNVSAPRRDSILRDMFEFFQILKHYKRMPPGFAKEVFAADITANRITTDRPYGLWLADIALLGPRPAHALFALDMMFEEAPPDADDHNRLIALVGERDPFGVAQRLDLIHRSDRHRAPARPPGMPMRFADKIGRNDLCPCGSGKKYKRCHGADAVQ
jgi:hypothetical protein